MFMQSTSQLRLQPYREHAPLIILTQISKQELVFELRSKGYSIKPRRTSRFMIFNRIKMDQNSIPSSTKKEAPKNQVILCKESVDQQS